MRRAHGRDRLGRGDGDPAGGDLGAAGSAGPAAMTPLAPAGIGPTMSAHEVGELVCSDEGPSAGSTLDYLRLVVDKTLRPRPARRSRASLTVQAAGRAGGGRVSARPPRGRARYRPGDS